ncbi:calcium-binding protein [Solicola gregarius]|uniref:Calcium-binding protein n=1 Tax=Solicola gregarius TaxID=2908642 RepID=A0AA46TLB8_9ACTN|nr:calcium-binding protein [Solicola gregarius]UYM07022.1 hypothetical protein L0C25_08080 [Solicola gregarius]
MKRISTSLISLGAAMVVLAPAPAAVASGQTVGRDKPRCHGAIATIVGTSGKDDLRGTPHRDVIVARGGKDTIDGFAGNDVICGGRAEDAIRGGPGDDTIDGQQDGVQWAGPAIYYPNRIQGGPGDDKVIESSKGTPDLLTFESADRGITADLAKGRVRGQGRDRLKGAFRIIGTPHGDRVTAPGRASMALGRGRDRVVVDRGRVATGKGDDTITVRANGRFDIVSGPGDDSISLPNTGSNHVSGSWEVWAGYGDDSVSSNVPGISIYAEEGNDRVEATASTWTVAPGPGRNTVIGSAAVDRVHLSNGRDTVRTNGGDDVVKNGSGRSNVRLGAGDDKVQGASLGGKAPVKPDTFRGGRGVDLVSYEYWYPPHGRRGLTVHLGKGGCDRHVHRPRQHPGIRAGKRNVGTGPADR